MIYFQLKFISIFAVLLALSTRARLIEKSFIIRVFTQIVPFADTDRSANNTGNSSGKNSQSRAAFSMNF